MKYRLNTLTTKIILHVLFWIGYLGLSIYFFYGILEIEEVFLRILIHVGFLIILVYFNFLYLLPYQFDKRRYRSYFFWLSVAIVLVTFLRVLADAQMAFSGKLIKLPAFSFTYIGGIMLSNLIMLSITSSFKFIEDWFVNQRVQQELRNYKLEAELKFLKTQVNPHFLFNALNNIYSLSYTGSKEAAPMILKLSEMMRYMIYEASEKRTPLSKEIQYLENYIELYRLKTEDPMDITFQVNGKPEGVSIEPLIFIPLLENSFKHGDLDDGGWMKAIMDIDYEDVSFEISNSIKDKMGAKDKQGGIGLENIQKRLKLVYPKNHEFEIIEGHKTFKVKLKINTR